MHPVRNPRRLAPAGALLVAVAGCHHGVPPHSSPSEAVGERIETRGDVLELDEMNIRVASVEELIQGRIPGVEIRHSGSRAWVEIRGQSSIVGSNEALIVVDGIQSTSRELFAMNPKDVQRIQVLKGASAAAYGVRGGNGVLVITTRRR